MEKEMNEMNKVHNEMKEVKERESTGDVLPEDQDSSLDKNDNQLEDAEISGDEGAQANEDNKETQENDIEDNLRKEIEDLKNKLARLQADFDNYKKRTMKEKSSIIKFANEDLICSLLPVYDNLERALLSMGEEHNNIATGIKMIYRQFTETLKNSGLEEIEAEGKEFDPIFHESVAKEPSEHPENTIIAVMQKGYTYNGKVIRPSMVKVSEGN